MVLSRFQHLEQQLVEAKNAEKTAHAEMWKENGILSERVAYLERKLEISERERVSAEEEAHHMALALKIRGGIDCSDSIDTSSSSHYTDDIALFKSLARIPSQLSPFPKSLPPQASSSARTKATSTNTRRKQGVTRRSGATNVLKRSYQDMDAGSSDDPSHKTTASPEQRIIVCIGCYTNKRRCDIGEPCQSCVDSGTQCMRAKCEDYKVGTCRRQSCLRAHESDEPVYKNLVWAGHVSKKKTVQSHSKKSKRQGDGKGDRDDRKPPMGQMLLA